MLLSLSSRRATEAPSLVELLGECHRRIRHFIGVARDVARRKDVPAAEVAQACAETERYFREALPLHLADEEESLAPRLDGLSSAVSTALATMRLQHVRHDALIARLLAALAEVRRDPDDEPKRDELAAIARPLKVELEEHLALEERVIFPALREMLPAETQAAIIDELRARRRPPGEPPCARSRSK